MSETDSKKVQITFRIPPVLAAELEERGKPFKLSAHAFARKLVIEGLAESGFVKLESRLEQLDQKYKKRWEDLLTGFAAVLANVAEFDSKGEIDEDKFDAAIRWVENNMPN